MPNRARKLHDGRHAATRDVGAIAGPTAAEQHPRDADQLDYGSWLLPPSDIDGAERVIRLISTLAGPIAMVTALALGCVAIA